VNVHLKKEKEKAKKEHFTSEKSREQLIWKRFHCLSGFIYAKFRSKVFPHETLFLKNASHP